MREPLSKRLFDIVFSLLGLVLSSWLWPVIWAAIIIEDGFPVFITQKRVGKAGVLFSSLKFRSMKKECLDETVSRQARECDPRVTFVGRLMRRTALDELPQLANILAGDMSFVGPRALLPREIEVDPAAGEVDINRIPGYRERLRVRPGLTGIAQVFARRDLPRAHKFKYDLLYIRKWSFGLDLWLIFVSFIVSFRGRWERRGTKLRFLAKEGPRD